MAYKDIWPGRGLLYKAIKLLDGVTSANGYAYSDPFETRLFAKKLVQLHVVELNVNAVTVKFQGRQMTAIGTYGPWVDLPFDAAAADQEFAIAKNGSLSKSSSESWAEMRIGYKSTVGGAHGSVDAYASVQ